MSQTRISSGVLKSAAKAVSGSHYSKQVLLATGEGLNSNARIQKVGNPQNRFILCNYGMMLTYSTTAAATCPKQHRLSGKKKKQANLPKPLLLITPVFAAKKYPPVCSP
ncbi:hypothetical protein TRIATDRAFT_293640 [Trichoderma atroviride IMI 206040]|uniref:Uncharacterized protein n=1 Tax=Hypocrea atroviridis (strain ATCC 20476 / IMI 206040) TaxID=452589 RepID=G9NY68_HYPAI|nr:uncharacterized protein TRIATDRAFT_293640 [Trichoderma atroviride IMI 206040]EHK44395.1 hypothetical protein TRIATDRAFT_293640 [Trichoderma atroviride IMI 206040]